MKILSKLMTLSCVLAAAVTVSSCSDDDNYTAGPQTNSDSLNVYFEKGTSDITLKSDANTFVVNVVRNTTKGALTIPLTTVTGNGYDGLGKNLFTVPTQVEFKDGEDTAQITVNCTDSVKMFKEYNVEMSIPEEYTTQYKSSPTGQPRAELHIVKEDYANYAKGTYFSQFFGDDSPYTEAAIMQYSKILDTYRFSNIVSGETFTFQVNKDNSITFGFTETPTGYVHSKYGSVNIKPSENEEYKSYYSPDEKTYYFGFNYVVSAGSFGDYYEGFIVSELY